jgi:hypothetical protein
VATFIHQKLATLGDLDWGKRSVDALLGRGVLNLLHNIVTLEDFTEDDMAAIKPAITYLNQFGYLYDRRGFSRTL